MATATFYTNTLSISKLELNVRKKPVKRHIWSLAVCGAEIWTLLEVDKKYQENYEMWC